MSHWAILPWVIKTEANKVIRPSHREETDRVLDLVLLRYFMVQIMFKVCYEVPALTGQIRGSVYEAQI